MDEAEGWLIWTKLGLLTLSAIVVPMLVPRQYIPVDPKVGPESDLVLETSQNNFVRIPHRK